MSTAANRSAALANFNDAILHRKQDAFFSRPAWTGIVVCSVIAALLPILNLSFPDGHALHVSSYSLSLIGKFMCYAMAALALDLVWGYTGILSLGHGVFFALGGYAHGMYLMREGTGMAARPLR